MRLLKISVNILLLVLIVACGSDSETGSSLSTTSDAMAVIPSATGEVVSSSESLARALASYNKLASTGVVLADAGTTTFGAGDSTAMCETAGLLKDVLNEAASPDRILCYIKAMAKTEIIPSNFADGEYHYIKLINLPDAGGSNEEPVVKMKITVTDSRVSDFKLFSCFNGSTASPSQSEYLSQTNSGSSATLSSKYTGSEDSETYGASATVTGALNSSGDWTSKQLEATNYFNDGSSNSYNMYLNMTQSASDVELSGYRKGSFEFGSQTQTFSDGFYTKAQILGADSLETFALGDGSSKMSINFNDGSTAHSFSNTFSWLGDSYLPQTPATGGSYYSDVSSESTPTIPSSVSSISFSSDEQWDCSLPSGESWVEADFEDGGTSITTLMTSCDDKFGLGSDWVSCSGTDQY